MLNLDSKLRNKAVTCIESVIIIGIIGKVMNFFRFLLQSIEISLIFVQRV